MRSETAHPCIAPARRARRIRRSSVPCSGSSRGLSCAIDVEDLQQDLPLVVVGCQHQCEGLRCTSFCTSLANDEPSANGECQLYALIGSEQPSGIFAQNIEKIGERGRNRIRNKM